MSSFSSILASLGGNKKPNENASSTTSLAKAKSSSVSLPTNRQTQKKTEATTSTAVKRKAEATTSEQTAKLPRIEVPTKSASTPSSSVKNGVVRPSGKVSRSSATTTAAATTPKPPKNSYREIMARAQLAQAKPIVHGQIKHKESAKLTKRQKKLAREAELMEKSKTSQVGRVTEPQKQSRYLGSQQTRKVARVDLGYKGTMRPKPALPDYKGTMKPSGSGATAKARIPERRPAYYSRYSDEEEDDGYDDDEDEEGDDDESVMGATGFEELEREEEQSLRAAKKEDEEALKEENERRRQKEEKRKRLEALAAKQAARR